MCHLEHLRHVRLRNDQLLPRKELAKKRLALEQAQVDEELAITASGGSSETLHRPELRLAMSDSGVGVRRKKSQRTTIAIGRGVARYTTQLQRQSCRFAVDWPY